MLGAVRELGKPYDWLRQASAPSCHGHLAPGPVGGHWDWHTLFMRDSMEGVVLFLWDRAPSLCPQISCLGLSESGNWSTSWMQSQLGPLVSPRLCPLRCGYVHTYAHQPPLLWFLPQQPQGRGRDSSAELAPPLQHVTLPDRKMLHALSSLGSWAPRQSRSDLFQNLAASLRLLSRWRLDVGEEEGATLGARGLA